MKTTEMYRYNIRTKQVIQRTSTLCHNIHFYSKKITNNKDKHLFNININT